MCNEAMNHRHGDLPHVTVCGVVEAHFGEVAQYKIHGIFYGRFATSPGRGKIS